MEGPETGLRDRRPLRLRPIALLLVIFFVTSCATQPGMGSPTPHALPTFPAITPIQARITPPATGQPSPIPQPTTAPLPAPADETVHVVGAGDTLLGLARVYGVPMAAIQLENDLGESTVVQTGQTLVIPQQEAWEGASPFWVLHEVKPDETLLGIARAHGVEPDRLQAVNGLDDADQITAGQLLILPLTGPAAPPTPEPTERPEPSPTPLPTPTSWTTPTESAQATVTATTAATSEVQHATAPADLASWPREIARLINEVRAEHGLPPYGYNATLEQAAQAHANDCADRGWCSHTGSDGADIKTRVMRAGYEATGWAECWAQTQSPQRAVEVWMDETPPNDPHRRTLLSDWFNEIGIGVSKADWGTYIIADFGRP